MDTRYQKAGVVVNKSGSFSVSYENKKAPDHFNLLWTDIPAVIPVNNISLLHSGVEKAFPAFQLSFPGTEESQEIQVESAANPVTVLEKSLLWH